METALRLPCPNVLLCREILQKVQTLKLSNQAVWDREHKREAEGQGIATPWFVKGVYLALCIFLDVMYENRPIQRFWFLETVARMPYYSYIACLHMYESYGWWRAGADLRKVRRSVARNGRRRQYPAPCSMNVLLCGQFQSAPP